LEDLAHLIVKNHLPMHLTKSQQLKIFSLHLCPRVVLPFRRPFSRNILSKLVEKIKQLYVLLALADCYYVTTSFDLWMSKGAYDIHALVIKFLGFDWQPKHIAIGLFEAFDTSRHALPKDLIKLLCKYDSRKKIITCV
jgi:hypothetical protein